MISVHYLATACVKLESINFFIEAVSIFHVNLIQTNQILCRLDIDW